MEQDYNQRILSEYMFYGICLCFPYIYFEHFPWYNKDSLLSRTEGCK